MHTRIDCRAAADPGIMLRPRLRACQESHLLALDELCSSSVMVPVEDDS